jgi:AcrR family transcriptional regulator
MQKEQTRLDLALAAFELAKAHGLANVRVPQIAAAAGVSPRTFNNYFASKEAAIVWPTTLRGARMAEHLAGRPAGELLADALVATVADLYEPGGPDHLPAGWLQEFRALAAAIARRTGADQADLRSLVLAAVVVAAERAAILQWFRQAGTPGQLVDMIRAAVGLAVRGPAAPDATLT